MAFPHVFGTLSGSVPASYLDDNFNAAALASDLATTNSNLATLSATVGQIYSGSAVTIPQQLAYTGVASATGLSGVLNDYSPAGLATASTLRLTLSANVQLNGIAGGSAGRVLVLQNQGGGDIILSNQNAASTAANRISLPTLSGTFTVGPQQVLTLIYDAAQSLWRAECGQRDILHSNRTFFVATTGSDSNDGLSASTPFLTGQKAMSSIAALDLNSFTATAKFATGTYAGTIVINGAVVGQTSAAQVVIQGDTTTPTNVVFSSATGSGGVVQAAQGARITVTGIDFTGAALAHVFAQNGARIEMSTCVFGAVASFHLYSYGVGASVEVTGSYTISGGGGGHYVAQAGAMIRNAGRGVTLTGTPAFSSAFAFITGNSYIETTGITFTGSATGTRYSATLNSSINTNSGGSATYFPGSVNGSTGTGGQYT